MSVRRRIAARLQQLQADGLYRERRVVQPLPGGLCRTDGRELVNFGGNDYLSLAHRLRAVSAADSASAEATPFGATASSAVIGRTPELDALESALAQFENTEAALVFPTGYAANLGVLQTLIEDTDAVLCDRDNHASIVDACRGSRGQFLVFRRDRLDSLEKTLQRRRAAFEQTFIVTDGVFSMDGTVADLSALCDLADRYAASVVVDEAHATGVLGQQGRGSTELTATEQRVLVRIGTMSKAMAGLGGFVVGDAATIDWIRNRARTQFFSTALPPSVCQAMVQSLALISAEPQLRDTLAAATELAHRVAAELGLQTISSGLAPIVPILTGRPETAVTVSRGLLERGFLVPAIRPPTVPQGTSRLRLSLCVAHSEQQIRSVLGAVHELLETTG
ncbi:MAG: 8-amino-7-oxononanoate synthase [Planctomycetaceae bacterium]|nr:8-amino-7-oxononanoate synthase [Planctomycetaceae bacterium]